MMTRCWKLTASTAILVLVALAAHAQEGADCPVMQKLTLDQVVGFINRKVPEQRSLSLIVSCHVSFSLNATALDRLTAAGVTDNELQVLNRETLALLTVEQAHDQVAGLEQYIADSNKAMAAERDAALQKLNAEYQIQRKKEVIIEPKDEFETTQEFNARKQQAEAAVEALDRKHDEDTSRLTYIYLAKANTKAQPFQARIAYLEKSQYPGAAKAGYTEGAYNPDTQTLPITIGGEEYLFDNVAPATARQIIMKWNGVTIARPYAEDEMKTRMLTLVESHIVLKGQSRQAKLAHMLMEAENLAKRQDFDGAEKMYGNVLVLAPGNQTAKLGLETMRQVRQKQLDSISIVCPAGVHTGLDFISDDQKDNVGIVQFLDPAIKGNAAVLATFDFNKGMSVTWPDWVDFTMLWNGTTMSGGAPLRGGQLGKFEGIRVQGAKDASALAEEARTRAEVAVREYQRACGNSNTRAGEGASAVFEMPGSKWRAVDLWGASGAFRIYARHFDGNEEEFSAFDRSTKERIDVKVDYYGAYDTTVSLEYYNRAQHKMGFVRYEARTGGVKASDQIPATSEEMHEMSKALKAAGRAAEYIDRLTGSKPGSLQSSVRWSRVASTAAAALDSQ